MKCKVGDLCVLIEDDPLFNEVGIIVEVLQLDAEDPENWMCKTKDGRFMWHWAEIPVIGWEIPWLAKEVSIPDSWLQPIKGLRIQETTREEMKI